MQRHLGTIATIGLFLITLFAMQSALAQKSGGILKISFFDNPASMSLHEEATGAALRPMMGVFNNLVMYDQHVAQNRPDSIIPDLATSWSWSEDGKELTFPLRRGIKWHDGKPFTAADVKCTWDLLLGKASEKLRVNPRQSWYSNLDQVTTNGEYEVTFHLKRPQPALLSLLASGWSPVYPCHVPPREMRTHPIGTGPFKFVEFKPNEVVRTARNPDYWKPGRPYLDGIEWDIIKDIATRNLTFIAGKYDISSPYGTTVPLLDEVKSQAPQAVCELTSTNVSRNLILNPQKPPFDNPNLRRAVALGLDRQAFIDIITQGKGDIGAGRRVVGNAAGDVGDTARLRPRHREEPRRSPQDHGEARLRPRPPARADLVLAQYPGLSRSGSDPH
jgi:peptide/nickel transport system substrate-binding protein